MIDISLQGDIKKKQNCWVILNFFSANTLFRFSLVLIQIFILIVPKQYSNRFDCTN